MIFKPACTLDDLWEGDMTEVEVDGLPILLVWPEGGEIRAFQGMCPHQDIPLAEGKFDGRVIMCRAHQWTFDAKTGAGVNPSDCRLASYRRMGRSADVIEADAPTAEGGLPTLADTEARMLRLALAEANGNLSLAARLLSISRPTLAYRLRKHKIEVE